MVQVTGLKPARGSLQWGWTVLGLEPGASAADIRRAYLHRARETHPDKGGSSEEFLDVAKALELLSGTADQAEQTQPAAAASEADSDGLDALRRFTLGEVSDLLEQVRQMQAEVDRVSQEQAHAQRVANEYRRCRSHQLASLARERDEEARLQRALRAQRRSELPPGIELCPLGASNAPVSISRPVKPMQPVLRRPASMSSLPSRPVSVTAGSFRATVKFAEDSCYGPPRRTIDEAEVDLRRLQVAAKRGGEAMNRLLTLMAKERPGRWS